MKIQPKFDLLLEIACSSAQLTQIWWATKPSEWEWSWDAWVMGWEHRMLLWRYQVGMDEKMGDE